MDSKRKWAPYYPTTIAHTWHNIETSVDCEWANRQLEFVGQSKSTAPKKAHVTRKGASAFGKYHK